MIQLYMNSVDGKKPQGIPQESRLMAERAAEGKRQVTPEPAARAVPQAGVNRMREAGYAGYVGGTAEVSFVLWDERLFYWLLPGTALTIKEWKHEQVRESGQL